MIAERLDYICQERSRISMLKFNLEKELPLNPDEEMLKKLYLHKLDLSMQTFYDHLVKRYQIDLDGLDWPSKKGKFEITENAIIHKDFDVCIFREQRYALGQMHEHAYYEISCVMHGSFNTQIASHNVELIAGDICIVAPNTKHMISIYSDDCIVVNLLVRKSTFDKAFFGTLTKSNILSNFFSNTLYGSSAPGAYLIFHAQDDDELEHLIASAFEEYNTDRLYKSNMINLIITMFFITLLRNHANHAVAPKLEGSSSDSYIAPILNYMKTNYKTVTIAELATVFNYSERHITRLFKEYIGNSFTSIMQNIKLNTAVELLSNPDLSIPEVAEISGFVSMSHFYKMFRKHYQMTPQQYRNK